MRKQNGPQLGAPNENTRLSTPSPRQQERDATMVTRIRATTSLIATSVLLFLLTDRKRDDRGDAVGWLIVIGASVGIAYFAGESVMTFAKGLVGKLGGG